MNKKARDIVKFLFFIIIAISPFITITNVLGLNLFLDSFEKPDYYLTLKNDNYYGARTNEQYLILQKSSHPDFNIEINDEIIYFENNGAVLCNKVSDINFINPKEKIYSINFEDYQKVIVDDNQIIGKIVKIVDDNIWNSISIKFWDISIHNLNLRSLV